MFLFIIYHLIHVYLIAYDPLLIGINLFTINIKISQ